MMKATVPVAWALIGAVLLTACGEDQPVQLATSPEFEPGQAASAAATDIPVTHEDGMLAGTGPTPQGSAEQLERGSSLSPPSAQRNEPSPPLQSGSDAVPPGVQLVSGWPQAARPTFDTVPATPAWAEAAASQAIRLWTDHGLSPAFGWSGGGTAQYPAAGCGALQRQANAVHVAVLDGPGDAIAVTHRCLRADTGEPVSVQVQLDADETWSEREGAYDPVGVIMHELVHAAGWEGHYRSDHPNCSPTPALLCPMLPAGSQAWRHLTPDDLHILRVPDSR